MSLSWSSIFLFRKKPKLELQRPVSLGCEATITAVNKAIMLDEDTADFTVRCETREFKVHKSFLCSRLVHTYQTSNI